jgi:replicative DNA helicase
MTDPHRDPPYDVLAEQELLGLCLLNNKAIDLIAAEADERIFYDPMHARMWRLIAHLATEGPVSPPVLYSVMKTDEGLKQVGGLGYVAGLVQAAPAISDVLPLVRSLKDLATRREMIVIGEDLVTRAHEVAHDQPARLAIAETTERLLSIGDAQTKRLSKIGDVADASLRKLEDRLHGGKAAAGISTGIRKMDKAIGGMLPGDRIGIAARTGLGKSAVAGGLTLSAARQGFPVLIMSADMREAQWAERTICDMDRYLRPTERALHYQRFRTGTVSDQDWERFVLARQELEGLPMHIDDSSRLTLSGVRGRARALAQAYPGKQGILCVDFFQKTEPEAAHRDMNRDQFLTHVAYQYGDIARDIGWTLLLLIQLLNKETDAKGQLRRDPPSVAAIRETGGAEQALDIIFSPYRLSYFLEREEPPGRGLHPSPPPDWLKWRAELSEHEHKMRTLGWKLRDGRAADLNLDLWCDMGSNAVRDEDPAESNQVADEVVQGLLAV